VRGDRAVTRARKTWFASVDRIEGSMIVLEVDDGQTFEVPSKVLPGHPSEGTIYRVPLDPAGKPLWSEAVADARESERRKADLTARMQALRAKDPGGDMKL
jgi:hypothetical protein